MIEWGGRDEAGPSGLFATGASATFTSATTGNLMVERRSSAIVDTENPSTRPLLQSPAQTRFRPPTLARYRRASAVEISSFAPPSGASSASDETPMLTVTLSGLPPAGPVI